MRATSTVAASIFAVVAGAATAQPAVTPGPSQPVKVTNDASAPVPVAVPHTLPLWPRLKPSPDTGGAGWKQLAVEIYGGPLLLTRRW